MSVTPRVSRLRPGSMLTLLAVVIAFSAFGGLLREFVLDKPDLTTATTVFAGVFVQAIPFLALGVVLSGLVAAYVSADRLARWLPKRPSAAIVTAGVAGAALPGCECGSVPVARRLYGDNAESGGGDNAESGGDTGDTAKVPAVGAAALTFMLAAPAINPIVLVATAVAFPGQPMMVAARCAASLLTAIVMGAAWSRWGNPAWITRRLPRAHEDGASRWACSPRPRVTTSCKPVHISSSAP